MDILRRPGRDHAEPASKLPALTFDKRDQWARNRQKFFLDVPTNRASLELIESAIVAITLDDADDYGYDPVSGYKSCGPLACHRISGTSGITGPLHEGDAHR